MKLSLTISVKNIEITDNSSIKIGEVAIDTSHDVESESAEKYLGYLKSAVESVLRTPFIHTETH